MALQENLKASLKKIEFDIVFQIDSFKEDILNKDITISVVDNDSAIKMFLDA